MTFEHSNASRDFQDRFDTRRLSDAITAATVHDFISDSDARFIGAVDMFFIASQPHSMSIVHLPAYQPFGGMPPQITAPWMEGLEIKAKTRG